MPSASTRQDVKARIAPIVFMAMIGSEPGLFPLCYRRPARTPSSGDQAVTESIGVARQERLNERAAPDAVLAVGAGKTLYIGSLDRVGWHAHGARPSSPG
jgi:hypothetical protein